MLDPPKLLVPDDDVLELPGCNVGIGSNVLHHTALSLLRQVSLGTHAEHSLESVDKEDCYESKL